MKKFLLLISLLSPITGLSVADSQKPEPYYEVHISYIGDIRYRSDSDILNHRFILSESGNTRAICYNCGSPTMGLATFFDQKDIILRVCPISMGADVNDQMVTYDTYKAERCTSCGFIGPKVTQLEDTYKSFCSQPPFMQEYEVRKNWFMYQGYDIHQVYSYWAYGIYI